MLQLLAMTDTMIDKVHDFVENGLTFATVKPLKLELRIVDQHKALVHEILGLELTLNFWLRLSFVRLLEV